MLRQLIGIILGEIICESSNWQHIQRLKITILGANWQLIRLERIAICSYFILSTQNIKFYWFVMKIKKFLLPIWCYNRGLFPLGNKYFGVFILNGLKGVFSIWNFIESVKLSLCCSAIMKMISKDASLAGIPTSDGLIPLHISAANNFPEIVRILVVKVGSCISVSTFKEISWIPVNPDRFLVILGKLNNSRKFKNMENICKLVEKYDF